MAPPETTDKCIETGADVQTMKAEGIIQLSALWQSP
jgi:hypothetical protein